MKLNPASAAAILVIFGLVAGSGAVKIAQADEPQTGAYDSPFDYSSKAAVRFPDFELRFAGTKPGGLYPGTTRQMADVSQFEITQAGQKQTVGWSGGTGDIGPSFFTASGQCFQLELLYSDKHHKLAPGQAVVSQAPAQYCR